MIKTEPTADLDDRFGDPDPEAEPTSWPEALSVIEEAELFWNSTVRAGGRLHVTPLPAVGQAKVIALAKGHFAQTRYRFGR